ncbi:MAG: DUF4292 domain-containing protein [Prevotella sp.]|nr:DUF4292 domain-containing protein [Prevotella sp.]
MERKNFLQLVIVCVSVMLAGCASKKKLVTDQPTTPTQPSTTVVSPSTNNAEALAAARVAFVKKVCANQVDVQNIVGDMKFNVKSGSKDITVPGSVHMRKNQVIRLQLFVPILGSEVGRLEFTPDYVLIIDRMHKEYVQADYNQLDFLKNNGLTFYSLQALFWNELTIPGSKTVSTADMGKFDLTLNGATTIPVRLKNGNMNWLWNVVAADGRISSANVSYASSNHGKSELKWNYDDFTAVGKKKFPAHQDFQFSTTSTNKVKDVKITINMSEVKNKDNWEAQTTVSKKYKKVEATDVLGRLLNL